MFKTDVFESDKQVRFVIYGKLVAPWVAGLRVIWEEKRGILAGREVIVDLKQMTAVDTQGMALLSEMQDSGARFLTAGVLTRFLVESMRKNKSSHRDSALSEAFMSSR